MAKDARPGSYPPPPKKRGAGGEEGNRSTPIDLHTCILSTSCTVGSFGKLKWSCSSISAVALWMDFCNLASPALFFRGGNRRILALVPLIWPISDWNSANRSAACEEDNR